MTASDSVPEGFAQSKRSSNLLDLVGPIYEAGEGFEYRLGLWVEERHTNTKGFCHGGVLAMLADVYLGRLIAVTQQPLPGFVTVNLNLAYLAPARQGTWLEASGRVDNVGKTLAHSSGVVTADGRPVLQASGAFQMTALR
jgi:acyl-coenzyme A thioesterase 13